MKREIKFKALIAYKGKPSEWVTYGINDKPDFVDMFVRGVINQPITEDLQFTGLFDKEGVEIYEGDLVATFFTELCVDFGLEDFVGNYAKLEEIKKKENYSIETVEFIDGAFMVSGDTLVSEWTESLEVIGNIYENPELL
jgi:uncharacterized phage protein (TIGR01671 family)